MSDYSADRIRKPRFFSVKGLATTDSRPRYVIGFDSEADTSSEGQPMLFQFSLPGTTEDEALLYEIQPKKHSGLNAFVHFLNRHCTDRSFAYLIYVWNLAYELTQIFHDLPSDVKASDHFFLEIDKSDWKVEVSNNKRQVVRFTKGKNLTVTLLDGYAFYHTSLDGAAKMLGLGEKYVLTEKESRARFTREHLRDPEFIKYAKRDAYITRLIGEYIANQHNAFQIPTTISAPHFASTVFKTHFLSGSLLPPSQEIEQAGLYSYHGGKNGYYLTEPSDFPRVWLYDITSAYPEAMRQLPNVEGSGWKHVHRVVRGSHALYCVSGSYSPCKFRGMQDHNGRWTTAGKLDGVWITSYELEAMLDHNEIVIESVHGFQMIGDSGGPLTEYVDRFFSIKQTTSGPERETAKLLLNSLYGKFFQKQPIGGVGTFNLDTQEWITTDPSSDYDYEAGGLYNPALASLITGYVRARIHRLEHKYDAMMTSTDGLFGFLPPDPSDLGKGLGQLKARVGRLRIWRERLYVFNDADCPADGEHFNSSKCECKFALHGFRGSRAQLEEIPLARGKYTYEGKQMITLKQSISQHDHVRYNPGTFVTLPFSIII